MSFHNNVEEIIVEACSDLDSEKQLQQQAQNQLKNQLWEMFEKFLKDGNSEQTSHDAVLLNFGTIAQIKENINRQYLPKLTRRQKHRKIQNWILIPIAFSLSLICIYDLISYNLFHKSIEERVFNNSNSFSKKLPKGSLAYRYRAIEVNKNTNLNDYLIIEKDDPDNRYLELLKLQFFGQRYHDQDYKLTNVNILNDAIEVLEKYNAKSEFNTYRLETYLSSQSRLPGFELFLEDIHNVGFTWTPYLMGFRSALLTIINYAESLKDAGQITESERLLNLSINAVFTFCKDFDFYIDYAVLSAIIKRLKRFPNIEQHKKINSLIKANDGIQKRKWETRVNHHSFYENCSLATKSITLNEFITDDISFDPEEIKSIRLAEYSFIERHFIYSIVITLSLILVGLTIINSLHKENPTYSFYDLKLSKNSALKFILVSIIIYQLYKLLPFSTIHRPLNKIDLIFIWELGLFIGLVLIFSTKKIFPKKDHKVNTFHQILKFVLVAGIAISIFYLSKFYIERNTNVSELFRNYFLVETMSSNPYTSTEKLLEYLSYTILILSPIYTYYLLKVKSFYQNYLKNYSKLLSTICVHISILIISLSIYSLGYLRVIEAIHYYNDKFYRVSSSNYAEHERRTARAYKKLLLNSIESKAPQK